LILPDQVPATLTDQEDPDNINFLIGGKHGSNMDTMILAQVDTQSRTVKMISIPRDIYFDGRKLNSYSVDQIKEYLGVITGFKPEHHMIIDMYAYIEVVDILGGIDIYLSEPVVDPSYKTLDNGVWGTLNYQVGWHHMSGVQSLRIARSRKTTSDFVRAERQQQILRAIKEKIAELDVNDGGQILKMADVVLSKIETDMSLKDIMTYQFKFKNFDLQPRGVLSTGNVLVSEMYVTPSAQARRDACLAERGDEGVCPKAQAAYILKPQRDWNAVRWYVAELLKDEPT